MKLHLKIRQIAASPWRWAVPITLALMTAPAQALGPGMVQQPLEAVSRSVEQAAERAVEQALQRRLAEQLAQSSAPDLPTPPTLPSRLSITDAGGRLIFEEVTVEQGWRAVAREWLVTLDAQQSPPQLPEGITLLEQRALPNLGLKVLRLRVDATLDNRQALNEHFQEAELQRLDRNHIYRAQSGRQSAPATKHEVPLSEQFWAPVCDEPVAVGMLDTTIATTHPALRNTQITQRQLTRDLPSTASHGTAVASLLVGELSPQAPARLPNGRLYNAAVFYQQGQWSPGATLMHTLEGLDWLAEQNVVAINLSMTGPDNKLLATAVRQLAARGVLLVAAVGNDGPASAPRYPAAYPEVIAVTAVDTLLNPYRWANRGPQVDFAALGVQVPVATTDDGKGWQSGTSFATPAITAAAACLQNSSQTAPDAIRTQLASLALDLGEPGRDPVFGFGLFPGHPGPGRDGD